MSTSPFDHDEDPANTGADRADDEAEQSDPYADRADTDAESTELVDLMVLIDSDDTAEKRDARTGKVADRLVALATEHLNLRMSDEGKLFARLKDSNDTTAYGAAWIGRSLRRLYLGETGKTVSGTAISAALATLTACAEPFPTEAVTPVDPAADAARKAAAEYKRVASVAAVAGGGTCGLNDALEKVSDTVLAERAATECLAGEFLHSPGLGWLHWSGTRWDMLGKDASLPVERVRVWLKTQAVTTDVLGELEDTDRRAYFGAGKPKRLVELAEGMPAIRRDAAEFDADPDVLNTPCGLVNLRTGEVFEHDPAVLVTRSTRGCYTPGADTRPDWVKVLSALREDAREYLRNHVGRAASGHRADIVIVALGEGENGKGALLHAGITAALGDYAMPVSDRLVVGKDVGGTEVASLKGARFLLAEEMTEGQRLNVKLLKQIADTETVTARHLYRDQMTFATSHSLFMTTNFLPVVVETDHGTWRRLALVRFPFRFLKPGQPVTDPEHDRPGDSNLKARLERGGRAYWDMAVTWAVEGARVYLRDGQDALMPPPSVVADTEAWRGTADHVQAFWDSELVPDPSCRVSFDDLHAAFNAWLRARGHDGAWAQRRLNEAFGTHHRTKTARVRNGGQHFRGDSQAGYSRPVIDTGTGFVRGMPPLPGRPRVWEGLRFRTPADDVRDEQTWQAEAAKVGREQASADAAYARISAQQRAVYSGSEVVSTAVPADSRQGPTRSEICPDGPSGLLLDTAQTNGQIGLSAGQDGCSARSARTLESFDSSCLIDEKSPDSVHSVHSAIPAALNPFNPPAGRCIGPAPEARDCGAPTGLGPWCPACADLIEFDEEEAA